MKSRIIGGGMAVWLLLCCAAFGDHDLSGTEVQQLLQELTSNPKTTWIAAGTITETKEEYRAPKTTDEQQILSSISENIEEYQSNEHKIEKTVQLQKMAVDAIPFNVRYKLANEYTMKTTTVVMYDGLRSYIDFTVESRQDSVQLPDELESNYMTEGYNLDWNGRTISCFDGNKYTVYTPPIHHALVDAAGGMPRGEIEPLSCGIIPWGYNYFTYDKLSRIPASAVEKSVAGHTLIQLTLKNPDGSELVFVLDPEKDYAPLSWLTRQADSITAHQYSDYELVAGSWVPTSIVIEKFDAAASTLLAGDYVTITDISGEVPPASSFNVDFGPGTLVEYTYDMSSPQLVYYYSNTANIDLLLAERLAYIQSEGQAVQNCATAALQYAALQLGRDILDEKLSKIVKPDDNASSMRDMKKYAESVGFYCRAVTTNVQTLKTLSGCQAILHIPGKSHFVLLDSIDDKYVWITDLSRDKFYYRTDVSLFGLDWTEGTALLISNQPIAVPDGATEIPDNQLASYTGGSGYTCTLALQEFTIIYCGFDGMNCYGQYQVILPRMGCEEAESGSCPEDLYIKKVLWPCVNDSYMAYACNIVDSARRTYYMWACN